MESHTLVRWSTDHITCHKYLKENSAICSNWSFVDWSIPMCNRTFTSLVPTSLHVHCFISVLCHCHVIGRSQIASEATPSCRPRATRIWKQICLIPQFSTSAIQSNVVGPNGRFLSTSLVLTCTIMGIRLYARYALPYITRIEYDIFVSCDLR